MNQSPTAVEINPALETISFRGLTIRFLVTGAQSNGSLALFEMYAAAAEKLPAPPHSHDAYDETIYGLEGVLTMTVDGQVIDVHPGEALCIPRGAVHRFDNNGSEMAHVLVAATPAGIGPDYFREIAEVLTAAGDQPPDRQKMMQILHRHGLTPSLPKS